MSAADTFRSYSDTALRGIAGFLQEYRPEWKETEWIKEQRRLVKAELEARAKEKDEACKP
jgi:hypothetical protein